jgi:hypothetical protein
MSKKPRLVDYLFVDEDLLRRYTEQIRDRFAQEKDHSWSISANLAGPKIESSRRAKRRELNVYERIDLLEVYLDVTKDLANERPQSYDELHGADVPRFVRETTEAVKVIIPSPHLEHVNGLKSFAVWVADPDASVYSHEDYVWRGTFLYLTEMHWDTLGFSTTFSGCSALQAIVNAALGKELVSHPPQEETWEPFGRGSHLHPLTKLQKLGVTISDKRKIKTLYRTRFMTNEQCYTVAGEERRVNDLLAYPVYIAAAD